MCTNSAFAFWGVTPTRSHNSDYTTISFDEIVAAFEEVIFETETQVGGRKRHHPRARESVCASKRPQVSRAMPVLAGSQ